MEVSGLTHGAHPVIALEQHVQDAPFGEFSNQYKFVEPEQDEQDKGLEVDLCDREPHGPLTVDSGARVNWKCRIQFKPIV